MSITLKNLETIEIPCKVLGYYSCEFSQNGYISVVTTSALFIYQIYSVKENSLSALSIRKYNVSPSNFILSNNVGLDINEFLQNLPQQNFYEGVLSTELSARLENGTSVEPKIIKASWSPKVIDDYDCALAVLSSTGSLEIVVKIVDLTYSDEFKSVYNITEKYTAMCRDTWRDSSNMLPLQKFNELKSRINETLPTAFSWSSIINNRYCILVVAHACGDLSFWRVSTFRSSTLDKTEVVTFLNVFHANISNINTILWKTVGDHALLFVGNTLGQINCLNLTNSSREQIIINGVQQLWSEIDQLAVTDIKFCTHSGKCYILFIKGSELIILLLNEIALKLDSYVFHLGNMGVAGIEMIGENRLLVMSSTGAIKEIIIDSVNSKLNVEWRHFYVNINWYIYQPLNIISSVNKVFFAFLNGPCKTIDTKDDRNLIYLVVFINTTNDPLKLLLNNPSQSFKNYWDCLEALRCQSLMDKQLSLKDITFKKHYDEYSLYQLKLLLWLSKLSEIIYENTGNINLSIKSYEDIFLVYTIKRSLSRIQYLLNIYEGNHELTEFQFHNIFLLNCYLKQIVLDDSILKLELNDDIVTLLLNVISKANAIDYPSYPYCLYCGEKLTGMNCFPAHFDMRCSISLMQVSKYPDYRCLFCGNIAHTELEKELDLIHCPTCDIPMYKRNIIKQ